MSRSSSSSRWLRRQQKDPFVRQAQAGEFRARSAFKLMEIDQRDHLFRPGQVVVDLGAAPGGWSQYAAKRVRPGGRVIAVDVLEVRPIECVQMVRGDFSEAVTLDACIAALEGAHADLVISDLAPNLTGIRTTDQARSLQLAELALDFAGRVLHPGGDMLIKLFQGSGTDSLRDEIKQKFQKLMMRKPKASRDESREFYVLARGYKV